MVKESTLCILLVVYGFFVSLGFLFGFLLLLKRQEAIWEGLYWLFKGMQLPI